MDIESTKGLAGTTCQACHGPGSEHIVKGLTKAERPSKIQKYLKGTCASCHTHHIGHVDIGKKSLPSLKKKLEALQAKIKELEG